MFPFIVCMFVLFVLLLTARVGRCPTRAIGCIAMCVPNTDD